MEELASWKLADLAEVICQLRAFVLAAKKEKQIVVQLCEI
jgi:hypothetical protein